MALKINHDDNSIQFNVVTAPDTPAAGSVVLYFDTVNGFSLKEDSGAVTTVVTANWFDAINNGDDFAVAPIGTGTRSIAIGNNATSSTFTDAIAVGTSTVVTANFGIAIGADSDATLSYQTSLGNQITVASVGLNLAYDLKLGYGLSTDTANYNLLHLYDSGKLELYGAEAQYVIPNYATGSIPATTVEGGLIYDSTIKTLKIYDGTSWAEIGGGLGTGDVTINGDLTVETINPRVSFKETDAPTDEGQYTWVADGGNLTLRAYDDAGTGHTTPISISRTGTLIDSVHLLNPSSPTTPTAIDDLTRKDYVDGEITALGTVYEPLNTNIQTHIADATTHRLINDAGTLTTELFSASKINSELATKSDTTHNHTAADITDASTELATFAQGTLADSALQNVVEDTTPQLGADLDANGFNISGIAPTAINHLTRKDYVDGLIAPKYTSPHYVERLWTIQNLGTNTGRRTVLEFDTGTIGAYDAVQIVGKIIQNNTNWGNALPTVSDFSLFVSFSGDTYELTQTTATPGMELELWKESDSKYRLLLNADTVHHDVLISWFQTDGSDVITTQGDSTVLTDLTGLTSVIDAPTIENKFVDITGDTMTGDLTVKHGASPAVVLKPLTDTGRPAMLIRDSAGAIRLSLGYNATSGNVTLRRNDSASVLETEVSLSHDGNVSVNGIAPTAINHLTRKDYVDAEISAVATSIQDVVFKTFADSPITVAESDRSALYVIDTSGGDVVMTLPEIATVTSPYGLSIKKSTADTNIVSIHPSATDTIDGDASKTLTVKDAGLTFAADTDTAPDSYTTLGVGAGAGNMTVDNFADGADYTSGITTVLTLSVDPGSENNIDVYFDGTVQHHTEYSVSGVTVTFSSAIPVDTDNIEVVIGSTLSVGTPADASVTIDKLADEVQNIISQKNYIINPTFSINQRAFAGGALADGIYGYDRWKANSASNMTLAGSVLTIASGFASQVIEDFGYTGSVTVSWTGTAQFAVGGTFTSPHTYTKVAGDDLLGFGAGTLSEVKFEIGNQVTPFEYPDIGSELAKCQRYFERFESPGNDGPLFVGQAIDSDTVVGILEYHTKRAEPTVTSSSSTNYTVSTAGGSRAFADVFVVLSTHISNAKISVDRSTGGLVAGNASFVDIRDAFLDVDAEL